MTSPVLICLIQIEAADVVEFLADWQRQASCLHLFPAFVLNWANQLLALSYIEWTNYGIDLIIYLSLLFI